MEYRVLPHGGEKIGVIGMGSSAIGGTDPEHILRTVRAAVAKGVNFFDMAAGHAEAFEPYGQALLGLRHRVLLQVHFGADYTSGQYGWTLDLDRVKKSVAWQLAKLRTDWIDVGVIHCMDEERDFDAYRQGGVLDYLLELKEKGVVRHIGLSSHTPSAVQRILDQVAVDVVMFSVNPLYDAGLGEFGLGGAVERQALYARCERDGVALVAMKPFCGGQLLDAAKSPFGAALTPAQCLQYALDKPGMVCAVPGFANEGELEQALDYLCASPQQRDYALLGSLMPQDRAGRCVYCRHCHPCPAGLDIALINKYYDLALLGDLLAAQHYRALEKKAGDCLGCGHCDVRCPFHAHPSRRMRAIRDAFGQ